MIKRFWDWLVISSADSTKLSLTIKGVLGVAATYLIYVAKIRGVDIAPNDLRLLIDNVGNIVVNLGLVVSGIATVFGLVRKIENTFVN